METKNQLDPAILRRANLIAAIEEAVKECERSPDDSTQDIWNEALESRNTGLRMNHRLEIEYVGT